jgi:hypothetical protein
MFTANSHRLVCTYNNAVGKTSKAHYRISATEYSATYMDFMLALCAWSLEHSVRIYKGDWGDISPGPEGKKAHEGPIVGSL